MQLSACIRLALLAAPLLLAACAGTAPPADADTVSQRAVNVVPVIALAEPPPPLAPPAPTWYASLDQYKDVLARHIVLHNADRMFTGPVPPVLPAVVVLHISVDHNGGLTAIDVLRSIDGDASRLAMDALRRSGPLPAPHNLLAAHEIALSYTETFLFNKDRQFQLRSLAPPQMPVD